MHNFQVEFDVTIKENNKILSWLFMSDAFFFIPFHFRTWAIIDLYEIFSSSSKELLIKIHLYPSFDVHSHKHKHVTLCVNTFLLLSICNINVRYLKHCLHMTRSNAGYTV